MVQKVWAEFKNEPEQKLEFQCPRILGSETNTRFTVIHWLRNGNLVHKKLKNNQRREQAKLCVRITVMDWLCRMSFQLEHYSGVNFFPNPLVAGYVLLLLPELQDTKKCPTLVFSCTKFTLTRSAKGRGCNTVGCQWKSFTVTTILERIWRDQVDCTAVSFPMEISELIQENFEQNSSY